MVNFTLCKGLWVMQMLHCLRTFDNPHFAYFNSFAKSAAKQCPL